MVTTEDGFLQDIIAHPDDDAPRLIFADWLDEHDRPERAELIRLQCALARTDSFTPQFKKLLQRERALLKLHKKEWAQPFRGLVLFLRFVRGFVEEVTVNIPAFVNRGERLFGHGPLRHVKFGYVGREKADLLPGLFACPLLSRLPELDFCGAALGPGGVAQLAACPHVAGVTWLDLNRNHLRSEGFAALARSRYLTGLRHLDLTENPYLPRDHLGDAAAEGIAASSVFHQLVSLRLWGQGLGDRALAILARASGLARLEELNLSENQGITGIGVESLCASPHLTRLRRLSLQGCPRLLTTAAQALAGASFASALRELNLSSGNTISFRVRTEGIGDAGLAALAASPRLAGLRSLDVSAHGITDAGARTLLEAPHLRNLAFLNLKGNAISKPMQQELRKRFGVGVCTFSRV
jgi:uncharacterized protein (TIGR02996 family)